LAAGRSPTGRPATSPSVSSGASKWRHPEQSPDGAGRHGSARFALLRELFAAELESGEDLGASFPVHIDGEMVVDLWGGLADEVRTMLWTENMITCVFCTTKTMTALVLLSHRELEREANVVPYRPECVAGATRESRFASCCREG
jgi:hypothetical protein